MREQTKVIQIGDRKIGGGNPVAIQSMTNTKTEDVAATVAQIHALEEPAVILSVVQYQQCRRQKV